VGRLYVGLGNYPKALEYCKIAFEIYLDFYGEEHYYTKQFKQNIEMIENLAARS
jgi:hypothetical protein